MQYPRPIYLVVKVVGPCGLAVWLYLGASVPPLKFGKLRDDL